MGWSVEPIDGISMCEEPSLFLLFTSCSWMKPINFSLVTEPSKISRAMIPSMKRPDCTENIWPQMNVYLHTQAWPGSAHPFLHWYESCYGYVSILSLPGHMGKLIPLQSLYLTVPHTFPWSAHPVRGVLMECSWSVHGVAHMCKRSHVQISMLNGWVCAPLRHFALV